MLTQAAAVRKRPKLWGVTVLTSLDEADLRDYGVTRSLPEQVAYLAEQAARAGLDGVIASGGDVKVIKQAVGSKFIVVTPGIRLPAGQAGVRTNGDDQKRAMTPWEARRNGADFFVMGRPILEAEDPVQVVQSIYEKLEVPV